MLPHSTPVNFEDKQKFISFKSAKDWRNSGKLIRNYAEIFKQFLTDRSDLSVAAKLAQIDKNLFTWILPTYDSTAALYDSFSGSGIVICVNDKYSAMGLATIRMIREIHHCDLPIEVFYMGASDLSLSNRKLFEDIKAVKVVDVETIFDKEILDVWGFAIKPFAYMASSFQNAMLIDADIIFLKSPTEIFKSNLFIETGALFFRDRTLKSYEELQKNMDLLLNNYFPRPLSKEILDNRMVNGLSAHQQESGVVLVDKKRNFAGMLSTCLLNLGESRESTYNMNMYGDKETFWIGFEAAGATYSFNPYTPGATGVVERRNDGKNQICSIQLIHVDENHEISWLNGALFMNKNVGDFRNVVLKNWIAEPGVWEFTDGHLACLVFDRDAEVFSDRYVEVIEESLILFTHYAKIWKNRRVFPDQISALSYTSTDCSPSTYEYQDAIFFEKNELSFRTVDDYQAVKYQRGLLKYLSKIVPETSQSSSIQAGIVYFASDPVALMASIQILNSLGSNLPIQVWYYNSIDRFTSALKSIPKVSLHSLKDIITLKPENPNFNHVARILAVSHSSFTEVLYINEDSLLLQYPAGLFASEAFSETGAVFWKSPFKTRPDNPIWKLLGLRCVDEYEAEYGMFLINKAFNGVTTALDLAIKVLENEIVYDYVPDGGGTLIKFCLRMVGNPFHIYPQESAMLYSSYNGIECGEEKGVFYDGKILFIGSLNGKRSKKSNPLLIVRICLMVEKGTAFGQP